MARRLGYRSARTTESIRKVHDFLTVVPRALAGGRPIALQLPESYYLRLAENYRVSATACWPSSGRPDLNA